MIDDNRIILISYPTGGFGNFIYYILSTFSNNTYKVDNNFQFSETGNSHSVVKYTPVYFKDPDEYVLPTIDTKNKILILCDNGINNDKYLKINYHFRNHKIIRMIIDEEVRPVIYATCIIKGMVQDINTESSFHVRSNWSDHDEEYAIRENYTLLYHNWPFNWNACVQSNVVNVSVKQLIDDPVTTLKNLIISIDGTLINEKEFVETCRQWSYVNSQYFTPYLEWEKIENSIDNYQCYNLSSIKNLHDQGYINYKIEKKYNITIPVYDYRNWFSTTDDITKMIQNEKNIINH